MHNRKCQLAASAMSSLFAVV